MRKKYTILIAIGVLAAIGGAAYVAYLYNCEDDWCMRYEWQRVRRVRNFDECVAHDFPVMESNPRECHAGSKVFTESLSTIHLTPMPQQPAPETMTLKVFFGSERLDPTGLYCERSYPVTRTVPKIPAVARAALEELFEGPTEDEQRDGYHTSINPGVKIIKLDLQSGKLIADFDAMIEREVGGSCRVAAIRSQITETLKQFPTVKEVIISVNGRVDDVL